MPRLKKIQRELDFFANFFIEEWKKSEMSEIRTAYQLT